MFGKGKISFGKIGLNLNKNDEKIINNKPSAELGTFGKFCPSTKEDSDFKDENVIEKEIEMSMGFSGFGKKAKSFDVDSLLEQTRKIAMERTKDKIEELENQKMDDEDEEAKVNTNIPIAATDNDEESDELIGPPLPPSMLIEQEDSEEEENEKDILPISHEMSLSHGSKPVTGLSVDPAGARCVTGGLDYEVKFWDFQGMDLGRESFRGFRPADGYPVHSTEYSCTGDKVLVVSGSHQAKVYDRDGIELFECPKGDMYLRDMAKTKGHISSLTDGKWHPKDKEIFLTSGRDGTCRLWHTSQKQQQMNVIKPRAVGGLPTKPTACAFNRDGTLLGCACDDGSIQMWDCRKKYVNVAINFKTAHQKGTETSCMCFSYDNKSIATRGGDDTLKLWDIRNVKEAVHEARNLFSNFQNTDCIFSPNDKMVITGTSREKGEDSGNLVFFDRNSFEIHTSLPIGESHVIRINWNPRLNQIMLGCGDGKIRLLYNPKLSHNGAVLMAGKKKKRSKKSEGIVMSQQVITPHALPLFKEDRHKSTFKQEERDRKDPKASHQPELPLAKAGTGGRVGTGGSTLSSYIIRNMGIRNKAREDVDPREALLKFAKDAADDPYWISPAYAKTQPNTIFSKPDEDEEEEDGHINKKQKL